MIVCEKCGCRFVYQTDLEGHYKAHEIYGHLLPSVGKKKATTMNSLLRFYSEYLEKHGRGYQDMLDNFDQLSRVFRYDDPEWKNLSEHMKEKQNYRCQLCGNQPVYTHHIIHVKHAPEKAFDLDNLMVLCKKCHDEYHKKANVILANYMKDRNSSWVNYDENDWHVCSECGSMFYGPLYREYCNYCWKNGQGVDG